MTLDMFFFASKSIVTCLNRYIQVSYKCVKEVKWKFRVSDHYDRQQVNKYQVEVCSECRVLIAVCDVCE